MYVQPVFILVNALNKQVTTCENISLQRREVVVSGDENCFHRAVDLWTQWKTWGILKSSESLFERKERSFELQLFSSNSLKENQARSREPRQKLWTYIHLRIAFVPTHRRRRKDTASSCSNLLQCFTNSVSKSWPASTNHDVLEISKQDGLFP